MKITSSLLECFHATVTVGTASQAAEMLNTSQSAVSRSLRRLEDLVGFPLFERSGNRLKPTSEAQILFNEVDASFESFRRIERVAAEIREHQRGTISVVCAPAFSQGFIVEAIQKLRDEIPDARISISTRQIATIVDLCSTQQCDLGLAAYDVQPEGTEHVRFSDDPEVCLLPASHQLAKKTEIDPRDLDGIEFVSLRQSDPYAKRLKRTFQTFRSNPREVLEVQNSSLACEAVAAGLGVSIINPFTAHSYINEKLVARPLTCNLPFYSTLLIPKFRAKNLVIECLRDKLFETKAQFIDAFS